MSTKKKKQTPDFPTAPNIPVPEKCEECGNTSFRQLGDKMICKACGHSH